METIRVIAKRMPREEMIQDERIDIPVQSLDENLIDAIRSVIHDDYIDDHPCRIAFGSYYSNMDLMNFGECFPYITRKGKYEWNVPYRDVTIRDFLETHDLEKEKTIKINIDCYGGGDGSFFTMIIPWLEAAWPYLEKGIETTAIVIELKMIINAVISAFKKKNKKLPRPGDVSEAVSFRSRWKKEELGKMLDTDNDKLLEFILVSSGFKESNGIYRRSKDRYRRYWNLVDEGGSEYWGDYENTDCLDRELDYIGNMCHDLNRIITDIMFNSMLLESDCYDSVMYQVNALVSESAILGKGSLFRFVELKQEERIGKSEREYLESELQRIMDYALMQLEFLEEKTRDNNANLLIIT